MNTKMMCAVTAVFAAAVGVASADPKEELTAAVNQLAEAENYAWTMKTGFGGNSDRTLESMGKTDNSGVIIYSMTIGDNAVEMVKKGDKGAFKRDGEWRSLEEIQAARESEDSDGQQRRRRAFATRMFERLNAPAADAKELLAGMENIEMADGAYTGKLTEEAVLKRLRPGRGGSSDDDGPQVTNPSGSAKFWVTDGTVTKLEVTTGGTMTWRDEPRDIGTTATTEITGIGETQVEIPEGAAAKLGE